jgi:hypothetical protein
VLTASEDHTVAALARIAGWCPEVTETYIDFFTATIRNRNTRAAYARACWQFFEWCAAHGLELTSVRPFHVAAWIYAEFRTDLLVEQPGDRPSPAGHGQQEEVIRIVRAGSKTAADVARLFGLHRSNITRLLARATD